MESTIVGEDGEAAADIQKKFWNHIKATKKDHVGTASLKDNGVLVSDPKSKANILNRQYQSVFSQEDQTKFLTNIPQPIEPPSPPMSDIVVSQDSILKLLLELKVNRASGPDLIGLLARILKLAASPLLHCLTIIFQASHSTGTVPEDWKQANITLVFKKGEHFKASNYRPVSLTCICSKLLEHVVVSQLRDHFDANKGRTIR